MTFSGTYTALATPFREGAFDTAAFDRLLAQQVEAGVDGVVAVGTTGESPTLNTEEHLAVIKRAVDVVGKDVTVIAGTGANATSEAVHLTQQAEALGAHASLQVAPYYNKPSQAGLVAHFSAIAQATQLPIMLYSIPGRCGIEIGAGTTAELARTCPNIVSIKEAGGSAERVSLLRQAVPESFQILSGDDSLTLPFMSLGARGVVSVASNLVPQAVVEMVRAANGNDFTVAEAMHRKYYPLFKGLFLEPNPVCVKYALARQGWMTDDVRLPLTPISDPVREQLDPILEGLGL
ncbi:MAG: 4-hydroxy-tetrahydrodipicolinate synthase [Verrucomicrobiota bacterium]